MSLEEFLLQRLENEGRVEVVGVASDFCVKAAITGFVRLGYPTVVWEDLCYGIDNPIREVLSNHKLLSPFFLRAEHHEQEQNDNHHHPQHPQQPHHQHHYHHHHHYQDELQKQYQQQQLSHTQYTQEQIHRRLELQQRILNHNRSKQSQVNDIRLMSYTHDDPNLS